MESIRRRMAVPKNLGKISEHPIWILFTCLIFWAWICFYRDVYLDPLELLPRDNGKYHYPIFLYVIRTFELLGHFPRWMYSNEGGIWIETLANNFLLLMPHRWLGYAFGVLFRWEPLFAYKVSMLIGEFVFLVGVYWVARELGWNRLRSCALLVVFFFSGALLSFLHQEHALGTLFFIPFMWLSLLRARKYSIGFLWFAILLGLSCNHHYPQLIFLYWIAVGLSVCASFEEVRADLVLLLQSLRAGGTRLLLLCSVGFVISASPVLYSYGNYKDKLESPFRHQKGAISTVSYEDYELINSAYTKADPRNFLISLGFEGVPRWNITLLDDTLFYASPCLTFLIFLLLFKKVPRRGFHLSLLLLLGFLSVGTYTQLPRLLMWITPGLKLFRQWYFFLSFMGLHALFALFRSFDWLSMEKFTQRNRYPWLLASLLFGLAWMKFPGIYVLPGSLVCLLLGFYHRENRVFVLRGVLVAWLLLGSLQGARFILGTYRENLIPLESSHLYASSKRISLQDPLMELRNIYLSFVALPFGMTSEARKEVSSGAPFYFDGKPGMGTHLASSGFAVSVPSGSRAFRWMQFNDGNWMITSLSPSRNKRLEATGLFPSVRLEGNETGILIERETNAWFWLVLFMWLPFVILLGVHQRFRITFFGSGRPIIGKIVECG